MNGAAASGVWAVVLAAGEGRRLAAHTAAPKQFCSFGRQSSMLQWALARARRIVAPERIVAVVAREHRALWEPELAGLAPGNTVVQPANRGTAAGLLLPLAAILRRDPGATVVVLPSDHHIEDEAALAEALREAVAVVEWDPVPVVLLGITPDAPEHEYGWILPTHQGWPISHVERFVEKPGPAAAAELRRSGALWNSFVLAANGRTLLGLFERALPELARALGPGTPVPPEAALAAAYDRLATADFSRDVLERSADRLRVLAVPACGWSDLGTPPRLERFLGAAPPLLAATAAAPSDSPASRDPRRASP